MAEIIHPKLSYEVRGVLFDIYNHLGPMLREEYYDMAIKIGLEKRHIRAEVQKPFVVHYQEQQVGLYYVDVWVEDGKMLIEDKVAPAIEPVHKAQAISYLKVTNADLALIANFGCDSFTDLRLPNFLRDKHPEFTWDQPPQPEGILYPELTNELFRACHHVHFTLGPGFLQQIYRRAMWIELHTLGLSFAYIKQLPVEYEDQTIGQEYPRLFLVDQKVLLAVYAIQQTTGTLIERLRVQMRRLDVELGLLANFHDTRVGITPVRRRARAGTTNGERNE